MSLEVHLPKTSEKTTTILSQFDESFLFKNALVLIDHGDYDLAINLLDTILQENPSHRESLKWAGYCYTQVNKIEKAIESFFRVAELDPTETNLFHLAEAFYSAGQDDLAKEYYDKTLSMIDYESPHLFQIYKKLGNLSTKAQDFESAEEFYDKAYTIMPHSDDLYVNYGTLEIQRGNLEIAVERYKQALALNSKNDKAWSGLALIYRARGDNELAWGNLLNTLDINPQNTVALRLAVDWSLQDLEYEKAIAPLEKYLSQNASQTDWIFTYAGLLYHSGDWKECQNVLHFILKQEPNYLAAKDLQKKINNRVNL